MMRAEDDTDLGLAHTRPSFNFRTSQDLAGGAARRIGHRPSGTIFGQRFSSVCPMGGKGGGEHVLVGVGPGGPPAEGLVCLYFKH